MYTKKARRGVEWKECESEKEKSWKEIKRVHGKQETVNERGKAKRCCRLRFCSKIAPWTREQHKRGRKARGRERERQNERERETGANGQCSSAKNREIVKCLFDVEDHRS